MAAFKFLSHQPVDLLRCLHIEQPFPIGRIGDQRPLFALRGEILEIALLKCDQMRDAGACGVRFCKLERVRIGALSLDGDLSPGEVREMTKDEADLVFSDKSV